MSKKGKKIEEFLYGVAYYPEGWPFIVSGYGYPPRITKPEWLIDLTNIKNSGLNTVRVCEFSWPVIEPEPGKYDFELYDKLLDRCAELGMYVIMGVDTLNPPQWVFEMYPDAWLINNMGQRRIRKWPSACFSHPGFRELSARYIENFITHYRNHPTIVAYQLDNEPAHHPPRRVITGRAELYCYCSYCLRRFGKWLEDKYGKDAPYVPEPLPEFEFFPDWLWVEWRLFNEENIVNKIKWVAEQVKKWDKDHPVTTNIMMYVAFSDEYSAQAHDTWGLAEVLDEMGMDYYSGLADAEGRFGYSVIDSAVYSLARSQAKGQRFYCLEIQPTTLWGSGWGSNEEGLRRLGDPRVVRLWTWRPIAYGAKNVTYWVWRTQTPTVYALVRPDGSFSEYIDIIREISHKLRRLSPIIAESKPYPSDVAILYSKRTLHLAFRHKFSNVKFPIRFPTPIQSVLGAFAALWQNRVQVDFIDVDRAVKGYLAEYRACFAPSTYVVEKELASSLKNFVENGGYLFTDALSGSFDEKIGYSIVPCNDLDELMLYRSHLPFLEEKPEFMMVKDYGSKRSGETLSGNSYVEEIEPLGGASIVAEFRNKLPAVVLARKGKGETMHVGTDLTRACFLDGDPSIAEIAVDFAKMAGASPFVTVSELNPQESKNLEITLLKNKETQIMFLLNSNGNDVYPKICMRDMPKKTKIVDIFAGKEVDPGQHSEGFRVSIEPYDVTVLTIKPKP